MKDNALKLNPDEREHTPSERASRRFKSCSAHHLFFIWITEGFKPRKLAPVSDATTTALGNFRGSDFAECLFPLEIREFSGVEVGTFALSEY